MQSTPSRSPLANHVALVTGASSGIGQATAVALGAAGAHVVVVARRAERLEDTVARIEAEGSTALSVVGDVSQEPTAHEAVARTLERFGRLDILVNAAGVIQAGNVSNADTAQWRHVIEVNLLATLYMCHAVLPSMRAQGSGNIVNVGSLACRTTTPIYNPYATSKFGVFALTDGLRQEVGPLGIRVCMISPGATRTEVAEGITDPAHREAIRAYVNQEGALQPEDVAQTVVFITSLPARVNISEVYVRATTDIAY